MKKVIVNASRLYEIVIAEGLLDKSGELAANVVKPCRAAILTDSNVAPLYLSKLESSLIRSGFSPIHYIIEAGESSKNGENYLAILSFLAQNKITRSDCLFALGGGVVGDLCGFCAATFLRGISFIQVPTTLLAMVDSSVGGKTAIDIPEGKNLVGAFYQPSLVICDHSTLATLSYENFRDGCAEVIKYGLINDKPLFKKLKSPIPHQIENGIEDCVCDKTPFEIYKLPISHQIEDIIENCVSDKRDVVNADERDTGVRQLLNLGHTAAHSIEILSNFEISHGSAVAIGMAIILRAAANLGLCNRAECGEAIDLISFYGLPVECPYSACELADIALSDKKRSGGTITLVMPYGIGDSRLYKIKVEELEKIFSLGI